MALSDLIGPLFVNHTVTSLDVMELIDGREVQLWEGVAPGSEGWTHEEIRFELVVGGSGRAVRNVVTPTITPCAADLPTDRAVIVLPGGALHYLCIETEGEQVAGWLNDAGVAAFVLKYRVVPTPVDEEGFGRAFMAAFADYQGTTGATLPLAAADAAKAVAMVRAAGYRHITLIGFSAGAIVSAETAMRGAARPDAAAIVYAPWVGGCVADATAPPLFVAAAVDDPLGTQGSLDLSTAWRAGGRPVELHLFELGGHGFSEAGEHLPVRRWRSLFLDWLTTHTP
jgi:acetyl esterase/lipase